MKNTEVHIDINTATKRISFLEKENLRLQDENRQYAQEVSYIKHELEQLKRMIFGSKSERYISNDDNQLFLDFGIEEKKQAEVETEEITIKRKKPVKKGHSRTELPAHLLREEIIIEPEHISEGSRRIGEVVTEILEYTPGKLFVKKYVRPKYVASKTEGVQIADMPTLPIPRGNAGPGLLAYLSISKFVDHLPFYRLVKMFKREGLYLAESTINDWFTATCNLLAPLYDKMTGIVKTSGYVMADETPIPVLSKQKKNATHRGYFWVYYSPPDDIVCFDYQQGRGHYYPKDFLESFTGTLQTDGYEAYTYFEKKEQVTLLACMAHARRYFEKALKNDPKRAEYAMETIKKLYEVERMAKDKQLSFDQRAILRQKEAIPVLKEMEQWLIEQQPVVLPGSAIGKAIAYSLKLWPRLKRYAENGMYEIDNNWVENTIRPVALGRKNYMFAGSHEGAKRAAMMYSFFGTCQKNNVDPYKWLMKVLEIIPDYKANRLEELLPGNLSCE